MHTHPNIQAVVVSKSEMMQYHDPERIQGYCRTCDKYGTYWSCPPFEEMPFLGLDEWTDAVIVTHKVRIDPALSKDEVIDLFQRSRQDLGEMMMRCETGGVLTVIAGHCFGCSTCTRTREKPCGVPARMRFSLEALGFDVTGLAEGLAGQAIHWPAGGMPDYLTIVGALLCATRDLATGRADILKGEALRLG